MFKAKEKSRIMYTIHYLGVRREEMRICIDTYTFICIDSYLHKLKLEGCTRNRSRTLRSREIETVFETRSLNAVFRVF